MEEQEKTSKIISLVRQITKNYFNENIDNDILDFKKKLILFFQTIQHFNFEKKCQF